MSGPRQCSIFQALATSSPHLGGGGGFFINDNEKHIRHFTQPQPCTAKTFFIEEDVAICMFVRVHCSCMPFSLYELKFETILFSMDFTRTGHSPQLLRQNDIKLKKLFTKVKVLLQLKVIKILRKNAIFLFVSF